MSTQWIKARSEAQVLPSQYGREGSTEQAGAAWARENSVGNWSAGNRVRRPGMRTFIYPLQKEWGGTSKWPSSQKFWHPRLRLGHQMEGTRWGGQGRQSHVRFPRLPTMQQGLRSQTASERLCQVTFVFPVSQGRLLSSPATLEGRSRGSWLSP